MRRFLFGLALASLALIVSACNRSISPAVSQGDAVAATDCGSAGDLPPQDDPADHSPSAATDIGEFVVGEPMQHRNLTIFPILSKTPQIADRFITLDEGLKAGTVEVRELGARPNVQRGIQVIDDKEGDEEEDPTAAAQRPADEEPGSEEVVIDLDADVNPDAVMFSGDVNRLVVVNRSDKPLYLMPGEVIIGGLQDRTIAEELVIAATGEPVSVEVYCVEHGRWAQRALAQNVTILGNLAEASGHAEELSAKADRGEFVAQAGYLNKSGRVAAQAKEGQHKVWEKVASANAASGVDSESGAFTENYIDDGVASKLDEYLKALTDAVAQQERVVGVVVAVNGKVESAEVFESTPLFLKLWPKLLKSFALDASHQADAENNEKTSSVADARAFLASILPERADETGQAAGGLVVSKRDTKERISFSAWDADAAPGGLGGGGSGGGAVHAAGFSK